MSKSSASIKNFEQNLDELSEIVDALDAGELSLEESLKQFERGIKMTRNCQNALNAAEQKVNILLHGEDGDILAPFDTESREED